MATIPLERTHLTENAPDPGLEVDSQANGDAHGDYPYGSEYITSGFCIPQAVPSQEKMNPIMITKGRNNAVLIWIGLRQQIS